MGGHLRKVGDDESHLRAPGVQSLLKHLARKAYSESSATNSPPSAINNSLCLVTTRVWLADLSDFQRREGSAWGSVLRVDLGNLTEEAGAALLHHAGAKRAGAAEIMADDTELLAASREVDGHALTLNLLGRFLARAHGGDIRRRDLVEFEEADRNQQGGTTFKMLAAFENWFAKSGEFGARQLAILRILGLFDRPAGFGCLEALRRPPAIRGVTMPLFDARIRLLGLSIGCSQIHREDWNLAVSFLTTFGLISVQTDQSLTIEQRGIDCHPLIREYFARQLTRKHSRSSCEAHRRLYEHLCGATEEKSMPELEDLQLLYQAVGHGCLAGKQREARRTVFYQRIRVGDERVSLKKYGAYGLDLGAIAFFFEQPWGRVSRTLSKTDQAWVLNEAAYCLRAIGRLNEAIEPMRVGLDMRIKKRHWHNAAISAGNLSELKVTLGEIASAIEYAKQSVTYANWSGDSFQRMGKLCTLADMRHQAGRRDESEEIFDAARDVQWNERATAQLYSLPLFRHCEMLLTGYEGDAWQATLNPSLRPSALTLPDHIRAVVRDAAKSLEGWPAYLTGPSFLDIALDHLTLGRAALYNAILNRSDFHLLASDRSHIADALDGCRRAGTQHFIPAALFTRAWLRAMEFDATGARADLDDAWDIAERAPMRLYLADIHLHRARLFFRTQPYPWKSPQDDIAAAEILINECGYHRRDGELADAKRAILGKDRP